MAVAASVGIALLAVASSAAGLLGAGGVLAAMLLTSSSRDSHHPLHAAHVQLARFRRTENPADVLVVMLPPRAPGRARRRLLGAARSVLRVTDGAAVLPSSRAPGLCAVLEPNARARSAIESRLRKVCGSEVRLGWAGFPEDGVTLESLIAVAADRVPVAADRVPDLRPSHHPRAAPQMPSGRRLAPDAFGAGRAQLMKRTR